MYPLNMTNAKLGGYAVANDADEHKALSDAGYLPAFVAPAESLAQAPADAPPKRGPGRPRKGTE